MRAKETARLTWMLFACLLGILTACASSGRSSMPRSSEPIPAVTCNEHDPVEPLPPYPEPDERLTHPIATFADALVVIAGYSADSSNQQAWAATVAGIAERERAKRVRTAKCL